MKLWPLLFVPVSLVLAGIVYILIRDPEQRAPTTASTRQLPRWPIERVAAPLPLRFAGPLPSREEDFALELENGPPLSHVRARLLEGDSEMGTRFLSALRQAAASAHDFKPLWETYGWVLGPGDHAGGSFPEDMRVRDDIHDQGVPCEWLRERVSGAPEENPLLAELLWRKLVGCPGPEVTALFARPDAPASWALDHHSHFNPSRFTPALENASRRILEENQRELFSLARAFLSHAQEPVAQQLSEELWHRASDEQRAEWEQEAASHELEKRRAAAHPPKCPSIPTRPEQLDEALVRRCVEQWAASNWAATARLAMSASRATKLKDEDEAFATLRHFPSAEALEAWARERKLVPEAAAVARSGRQSLYLSALMSQGGQARSVNLRSLSFPHRHDELLVSLAWVVRPALAGVAFEQLAPKAPPQDMFQLSAGDPYTLRAYADGQRFSAEARNSYALADIGAVLGVLNQVLEARGSAVRFAVLETQSVDVTVVFGHEEALLEADARGLFRVGDGAKVLVEAEEVLESNIRYILGERPF